MSEISRLKGVGPKRVQVLANVGVNTFRDLVYYLPRKYQDRTDFIKIDSLVEGGYGHCVDEVQDTSVMGFGPKERLILHVSDGSSNMALTFFNGVKFLKNKFKVQNRWFCLFGYATNIVFITKQFPSNLWIWG